MNGIHEVTGSTPVWSTNLLSTLRGWLVASQGVKVTHRSHWSGVTRTSQASWRATGPRALPHPENRVPWGLLAGRGAPRWCRIGRPAGTGRRWWPSQPHQLDQMSETAGVSLSNQSGLKWNACTERINKTLSVGADRSFKPLILPGLGGRSTRATAARPTADQMKVQTTPRARLTRSAERGVPRPT